MRAAVPFRFYALVAILALAATLRFAELPFRGLIYWDEGKFLLEGVRLETGLRLLAGAHSAFPEGKAIGTAKPTHALLIALSFALLGIHDYSALCMNALASVVSVLLVYRIAGMLFDATVGLIAALILTVSEYDVIYARSALSESDAIALLLAGVLLWLMAGDTAPRTPRSAVLLTAAGVLCGLAFTTNYRISIYVAAIVAVDLIHALGAQPARQIMWRATCWLGGGMIPPLLWEAIDRLARAQGAILFRSEITRQPTTYLGEAVFQIHQGKQARVLFGPLPYLQWFVAYEGWILTLLLALALACALRFRAFPWLALLAPIALPYLLYIWAPVIVPRNLAAAIPFTAMLSGAALVLVLRRIGRPQVYLAALGLAALVLTADGTRRAWQLSAERSGFTAASRLVAAQPGVSALTTNEIPVFYLRGSGDQCRATKLPFSLRRLSADIRAGYTYAIFDHVYGPVATFIHGHERPIARYPASRLSGAGQNLIAAENGHTPDRSNPIPTVTVYRLRTAGLPPPDALPPQVCSPNVL